MQTISKVFMLNQLSLLPLVEVPTDAASGSAVLSPRPHKYKAALLPAKEGEQHCTERHNCRGMLAFIFPY